MMRAGAIVALASGAARADLAADLAEALDLPPGAVLEATLSGSDARAAAVVDAGDVPGFPAKGGGYVLLSTGLAADALLADDNDQESYKGLGNLVGDGSADDRSTVLDGPKTQGGGDIARLRLVLAVPPGTRSARFVFQYFTEEFPEFVGSEFNDAFLCEVDGTGFTIGGDGSIDAPMNVAFDAEGRPISVNSAFGFEPEDENPRTFTTYDGTTGRLTTTFPIAPDATTVTVVFTVLDASDGVLDSAVALDDLEMLGAALEAPTTTATPFQAVRRAHVQGGGFCAVSGGAGGVSSAEAAQRWGWLPPLVAALAAARRRRREPVRQI